MKYYLSVRRSRGQERRPLLSLIEDLADGAADGASPNPILFGTPGPIEVGEPVEERRTERGIQTEERRTDLTSGEASGETPKNAGGGCRTKLARGAKSKKINYKE